MISDRKKKNKIGYDTAEKCLHYYFFVLLCIAFIAWWDFSSELKNGARVLSFRAADCKSAKFGLRSRGAEIAFEFLSANFQETVLKFRAACLR